LTRYSDRPPAGIRCHCSQCSAAQALTLKRIKESRVYEALGFTWDECGPEHFGISRVTADRIIRQLNELGRPISG